VTSARIDWPAVIRRAREIVESYATSGYRRPTVRYERKGSHFLAFLGLAAILTCYKKLAKLTT
jgi:hypothetical protein